MTRRSAGGRRGRDEAGNAVVEFTWLGVLLLVPLVYLLIAVFDVQRGAFATTTAARAAGRAFSLADSPEEGRRRAQEAARLVFDDHDVEGGFDVQISCHPQPCLSPGSVATVVVTTQVVLPLVPDVLGGGQPTFRVTAEHRVPTGKYVEGAR